MTTPNRHQQAPTPVRMPDDLKSALKREAAANHRSLSSEIVHRLEQTRSQQPATSKGTL
ncbi:Arc family DNA-binding protein [Variovorax sp. ZT4R33]|uniref:Arc family DNA-binding protein n=1 Tax=Variovorax sp. ZT4R33 TaxID=3443743 RepID=UPI003F48EB95